MGSKVFILTAVATLSLAGCNKPEASKPVVVNDEMTQVIIPETQTIWDVSNATFDDDGNPSAAKMTPEAWTKVQQAVEKASASLDRMAKAEKFLVVSQGGKIQDEDTPTGAKPSDVQKRLDANPEGFRTHARDLKAFYGVLGSAIAKRDFTTFYAKANEIDGACEACHKAYWFNPAPSK